MSHSKYKMLKLLNNQQNVGCLEIFKLERYTFSKTDGNTVPPSNTMRQICCPRELQKQFPQCLNDLPETKLNMLGQSHIHTARHYLMANSKMLKYFKSKCTPTIILHN